MPLTDNRAQRRLELLEREEDLGRLLHALDAATLDDATVVAVTGPMGIGKSRLLSEAAERTTEMGHRVLHATAGELERDYPFGVVLTLFEAEAVRCSPDVADRRFRGRAAAARPMLTGAEPAPDGPTTVDEFALLHGLYWFAANLAEEQPLILIVDDVHWADDLSLRFLLYVAQRVRGLPVLLVVGARTGEVDADRDLVARLLETAPGGSISPAPLSPAGVAELLSSRPREAESVDVPAPLGWELTGGNPFLLDALIRSLASAAGGGAALDVEALRDFAPDQVRRALLQQVERLGGDAVDLASASAVLGLEASRDAAVAICGLDAADATAAASRLAAADILHGDHLLTFRHPMYRSAVYGALAPDRRAELHARAARFAHQMGGPDEQIAHHLLIGASVPEPWAIDVLHHAAQLAAQRGAPMTAVRLLRRALADCDDDRPPALLFDLALYEAAAGESVSLRHFTEAVESFDDDRDKAEAMLALGRTLHRYGHPREASDTLRRAWDLARGCGDAEFAIVCQAAYYLTESYSEAGFAEHTDAIRDAVAPILERGDPTDAERALLTNAVMRDFGDARPAVELAEHARLAFGEGALLRAQTSESVVLYLAIEGLLYAGCLEEATEAIDAALADARLRGSNLAMGEACQMRAMIMYERGDLDEAMSDAQEAIDAIDFGYALGSRVPHAILAECLLHRGDLEGAQRAIDNAYAHGPVDQSLGAWVMCAQGQLLLQDGRAPEALELFLAGGRLLERHMLLSPALLPWRSRAAVAAHLSGRPAEAAALAEAELRLARQVGAPGPLGRALRASARIADSAAAVGLLLEAASVLESSDSRLDYAMVLLDLGRVQRRHGRRANARDHLRNALDLAHRCGATALERDVQEELRAAGARPRRQVLTGFEALTPTEQRVALLAAKGMANREVAEALFVTKNTVDWHLRNAYTKLGVHRRDELREALGTHAELDDAPPDDR
ncbi:MAG TPA: AAA family ATPase [Baekduia sp.]|nr:AAA family ATPase [Baekduia sp.]